MIRNSTNQLSIKPRVSNTAKALFMVGGVIVALALLYAAYSSGVNTGHNQLEQDRLTISQLDKTISELRRELSLSKELMVNAQRQKQIQEEAYKQVSTAYVGSEQKNSYLGSRLDFYRSIISPENGQSGPAIQSVSSTWDNAGLNFDITLVQAIRHKHHVQGSMQVFLYDNDELLGQWPQSSKRSVNFQYFQQISGAFEATNVLENAKLKVVLSIHGGEELVRWFETGNKSDEDNHNPIEVN